MLQFGMDISRTGSVDMFFVVKWFAAESGNPESCCALDTVETEYSCQGLETDMPMIGWDKDMLWNGNA